MEDKELSSDLLREREFHKLHRRSLIRTFTYHPRMFMPQKVIPVFETKRLRRSYSTNYYKKHYSWEKCPDSKFQLTKTKIMIPDFAMRKLEISSEMILKALDNFIVRKERVISSKGFSLTSIAFIRPVYLKQMFF